MEFLPDLLDPNARWVMLGVMAICASSATIGSLTLLRKQALVGDAISHSILPGVCLAFLIFETKAFWVLLPGAFVSGWISLRFIDWISQNSRIKSDTAIALVLSIFYGLGILMLTSIQHSGNAAQSGLDKFLFGKAAALMEQDGYTFLVFGAFVFLFVSLLYRPLRLLIFDRDFALTTGFPVFALELLLSVFTVSAIAMGIQAVGVVLMAALLISPGIAAKYWTSDFRVMLFTSAILGASGGFLGAGISLIWPKMPTGPWIVLILSLIALISAFLGTRKGVLRQYWMHKQNQIKILEENILKCFYHLGEPDASYEQKRSREEIQARRHFPPSRLNMGLKRLGRKGLLASQGGGACSLTEQGIQEARRIIRVHRLWEIYISKYMHLASDHVHEDAEAIEHIITPELEKELEHQLEYPIKDPHDQNIPYAPKK